MIQLLTEREIEFLSELKVLILKYNAEIYCEQIGNIQCIVDAHLNPDWLNPITFSNCLDEHDIDGLFEENRTKAQEVIERGNHDNHC